MGMYVRVAGFAVLAFGVLAVGRLEAQGLKPNPGLPGPKTGGVTTQGSSQSTPSGSAQSATRANVNVEFSDEVLEMSPETLDRFAKALAQYETARKEIAAKANAPLPKATKTKEEYQQCQMGVMMNPDFQKMMQDAIQATTSASKDMAKAQKAATDLNAKMEAWVVKECGADPSKTYTKPDVGSQLRGAQSEAAKSHGFSDRQYSILRERITPFCFSDQAAGGSGGVKIKGDGPVFYVYTASEVEALQPRCEAFTKALYPNKR